MRGLVKRRAPGDLSFQFISWWQTIHNNLCITEELPLTIAHLHPEWGGDEDHSGDRTISTSQEERQTDRQTT